MNYNDEQPGLGKVFLAEMEELLSAIAERPLHFAPVRRSRARAAFGTKFPTRSSSSSCPTMFASSPSRTSTAIRATGEGAPE
jgi:hypothetical protein